MVSFSCEVCNDTVVKKKLMQHRSTCAGAHFTCLDCQTTFQGLDFQKHTSCISEAEKYQKGLYKAPSKKLKAASNVTEQKKEETVVETTVIQVSARTTASEFNGLERKENAKNGEKKETKSPTKENKEKKDKKDKKDKKVKTKEGMKKESTDVTTERKEDKADPSPDVNGMADDIKTEIGEDNTLASPSESKSLETKADRKSKKENIKRKRDETMETKAESSDSDSDPNSDDFAATTGAPKDKKAKVGKPAEAAKSNGVANGNKKVEIPSDVVRSHIQSMVARGGVVSFKSLVKHLRRNKETHLITKAEIMRRLVLKTEGDKLVLSIAT
ncbi:uncharacterized protein V1513DRAFT_441515 [Lipomyces chichibuensis]|uniref:uncharacterized protein n=1 Tax=Lipomyces chichibuensis TaxID=1546026 RepID=UPI003343A182